MAKTILKEVPATPEVRDTLDITDEIIKRLSQASAISALMGIYPKDSDSVPDSALPDAAWAVRDLMEQTDALVMELYRKAKPAAGGAQ